MIEEIYSAIQLAQHDRQRLNEVVSLSRSVTDFDDDQMEQLFGRLSDFHEELPRSPANTAPGAYSIDQCLQPVFDQLVIREKNKHQEGQPSAWSSQMLDAIHRLYVNCPPESELRCHLLRLLATAGSKACLRQWADMVCGNPPHHRMGIVLVFAPLMQANFEPPAWMLDQLLNDGTSHSQIAPAVYDLFNFFYRQGLVQSHPAANRNAALTGLLGQLTDQMNKIESGQLPPGATANSINLLISDSVALIVSICDMFALQEYHAAVDTLKLALKLRHRRVQTEVAAALTRLGDDGGQATLLALAHEPIARLRVLAYAEELGLRDQISLELQGEISLAESHLAIWLAEPSQLGLPPSKIELVDAKEMYWPGYDHPVQCFLFRYAYGLDDQGISNIGICGPMTHAFAEDISHLPVQEIYALFAGWQSVHQEIFYITPDRAEATYRNDWRRLVGDLHAEGYDQAEINMAASFFGQLVLIATATVAGQPGYAIIDAHSKTWYPAGDSDTPLNWSLAFSIWKGRQMLDSFNETV